MTVISDVFLDHYAKEIGIMIRPPASHVPAQEPKQAEAPVYQADLSQLRIQALACDACALCQERQQVVFGMGNPHADVMFIGEAPNAEEEKEGIPFVGQSKQIFAAMLQAMGLQREQVYLSNVVLCRPPEDRHPELEEGKQCRYWLEAQWQAIQPRVVCLMGKVAMQHVLGEEGTLAAARGKWFDHLNTKVMVTYHPAHLLRAPSHKAMAWQDLQMLKKTLA
ncbi:MAG: uracil-DNA glycosylase [Mariprofundaceae bacterium]|nr:uracil-DNA glycosylase [Mariprofundaceae bacterium]